MLEKYGVIGIVTFPNLFFLFFSKTNRANSLNLIQYTPDYSGADFPCLNLFKIKNSTLKAI